MSRSSNNPNYFRKTQQPSPSSTPRQVNEYSSSKEDNERSKQKLQPYLSSPSSKQPQHLFPQRESFRHNRQNNQEFKNKSSFNPRNYMNRDMRRDQQRFQKYGESQKRSKDFRKHFSQERSQSKELLSSTFKIDKNVRQNNHIVSKNSKNSNHNNVYRNQNEVNFKNSKFIRAASRFASYAASSSLSSDKKQFHKSSSFIHHPSRSSTTHDFPLNFHSNPSSTSKNKPNPNPSLHSSLRNSLSLSRSLASQSSSNKQHIISIIQYLSNQVGLAIFNTTTGSIHLCQIVQRLTYTKTISTLYRFSPHTILYPITQQTTILFKKLGATFPSTNFQPIRRNIFDETKGFKLYSTSSKGNPEDTINTNPDSKFVAYAALNALVFFIERRYEVSVMFSVLPINWHYPQDMLIVEVQTLIDLEVFFNNETKRKEKSFMEGWKCWTKGGTRMLRANLLQPLCKQEQIEERQDLVQVMLDNTGLCDVLREHLQRLKEFETVSIKFIHNATKITNYKVIKTYISSIVLLHNSVSNIISLSLKLNTPQLSHIDNPILLKLLQKLSDTRIIAIQSKIFSLFDPQKLFKFSSLKSQKSRIDALVFLIKQDALTHSNFITICRTTYSRSVQDINKLFEADRFRSGLPIYLVYQDRTGYSYSCRHVSEKVIRQSFEGGEGGGMRGGIVHMHKWKGVVTFVTREMVSLNNKLRENENMILEECFVVVRELVVFIQGRINVLFEVNYWLSMVDMVLAFANYVLKNRGIVFTRPVFSSTFDVIRYTNLTPVWFNFRQSPPFSITQAQNILFHSRPTSFSLASFGFLVILAQIGSFVPCSHFTTSLFRFFVSKFNIEESVESKLSHFQTEVSVLNGIVTIVEDSGDERVLVLVDEVVRGTNQIEELAIGLGWVERVREIKGFVVGVTADEAFGRLLEGYVGNARVVGKGNQKQKGIQKYQEIDNIEEVVRKLQFPEFVIEEMKMYQYEERIKLELGGEKQLREQEAQRNLTNNMNMLIELVDKGEEMSKQEENMFNKLARWFEYIL